MTDTPPRALTIAGSDSGGGAGIEADLKTFTALNVFGTVALTSVTAQNTLGVDAIHDMPSEIVAQQIDSVLTDIGTDAVKSGMLSNADCIRAVAERIRTYGIENYVLDPVMVSESGSRLLNADAEAVLAEELVPLASVVTPNIFEAEALTGVAVATEDEMRRAGEAIHRKGCAYVLMKGGHLDGNEAVDLLFDGAVWRRYAAPRVATKNTHGTGCTYSAAIAAYLARGHDMPDAVERAKRYVTRALESGFDLGAGPGPLNHFWMNPGG